MTKKSPRPSHLRPDGKSRGPKSESGAGTSSGGGPTDSTVGGVLQSWFAPGAVREVVESVVIAFVLAFLFRTFEAEAFVIPTGSMAPTLMGRHKDVFCDKCGFEYQASASSEVDPRTGSPTGSEVVSGTCPNCRYTMDIGPRNSQHKTYPSFTGDRILVGKFPYQFSDPERWDVAVFRYPGGATTNYIKRIVGLPRETIRIRHGDLWVKSDGSDEFSIARKAPEKILAVLQPVYDNDHVLPKNIQQGWPARWTNEQTQGAADGWKSDDYRSFHVAGSAADAVWLRYRHCVPAMGDWQAFLSGSAPPGGGIRPQLVSDFCAYNTGVNGSSFESMRQRAFQLGDPDYLVPHGYEAGPVARGPDIDGLGLDWVSDLAVEVELEVQRPAGEVVLELVKGGRLFQCTFDLANGAAALSISGQQEFHPRATTAVRGPGRHRILLANVDQQLTLWVDGRVVQFDAPTTYDSVNDDQPQPADLAPVGIASRGAQVRVDHLKVFRDLYYIATDDQSSHNAITDFDQYHFPLRTVNQESIAQFLSEPSQWESFSYRRSVEFHLKADQFLVLGDNSAQSRDSRLWGREYYVKRDLLIGKALFIYWPHSWNRTPYLHIPFPFFPNFARMGLVR